MTNTPKYSEEEIRKAVEKGIKWHGSASEAADAVLAALPTVPSDEEVETYIRKLRAARYDKDNFPRMDRERAVSVILAEKTADLLQRLDRERQGADIQAQYWYDRCADTMDRLDLVTRQRDEALKALDKIGDAIDGTWKGKLAREAAAKVCAMSEQEKSK